MTPDLDQLVADVAEMTGVAKPAWLEADAPVLVADASAGPPFYLIGLIGGKDVGKSALVNALVGHEISPRTSYGPGTETVIAYAHAEQAAALRELLEREVPGRYAIVEHHVPRLFRQVLLDLPDIDSHWGDHVAITRRMLRHMLFPIWMQSIEKYADRQPRELLVRVAAGNAPANFIFCLNKVDQLERSAVAAAAVADGTSGKSDAAGLRTIPPAEAEPRSGASAIPELQEDYAGRLQRSLELDAPPRVWAISAIHPDRYDLPALRDLLAQQKSAEAIRDSQAKAAFRQKSSVLAWVSGQDLPARAARLGRLQEEAEEVVNERLGVPLLDTMLPRLLDDPLYRQAITDECMAKRVARWPLVNILHAIFAAIGAFFRRNAEAVPRPLNARSGEALVDQQLVAFASPTAGSSAGGRTLGEMVQTTFALLQQSHPALSELYKQRKLWESVPASTAAGELRQALVATVDLQRSVACARVDRGGGHWGILRALLTIGALIWFPFVQPIVEAWLTNRSSSQPANATSSLPVVLVRLLSINTLMATLTSLIVYFAILWLVLRWDTQRRVSRQFARWKRLESADPTLSLTGRTLDWLAGLLEPIRRARERMESLGRRAQELRESIS
jgi:hypothetical protein